MKFLKIILAFSLFCKVYSMEQISDPLSNDLYKNVLQRVVVHYVIDLPFLKEKYTEDDLFDFAVRINTYRSPLRHNSELLKYIASCKRVCTVWYKFVEQGFEDFTNKCTNIYMHNTFSPASLLAYIHTLNLCDLKNTQAVHFPRINLAHKKLVADITTLHGQTLITHLLNGFSLHKLDDNTTTTMLYCVTFPKNNTNVIQTRTDIHIAIYFLFTGRGDALLAKTNRNENGDFTFKGFFSFINQHVEHAKNMQKEGKSSSIEDSFIDEQNARLLDLETPITNMHNEGHYSAHILLSKDEEQRKNEEGTSIKGIAIEEADGAMTEVVYVRIPLYTVFLSFLNAILQSKFVKSDGHTTTIYFGKDEVAGFTNDSE